MAQESKDEIETREVKEVATKLRHLGPIKQTEVVNQIISTQVSRQLGGFTNFLREQSVIGIGIGLVLGSQLKAVVDSFTNGLVNPLTTLFLPGKHALPQQVWRATIAHRSIVILWGDMVYQLLNFVLAAFIVYAIFKLLKLDKLAKKK